MGLKDRLAASASRLSLASTLRPQQDEGDELMDAEFERSLWDSKSAYGKGGDLYDDDNASVFSFTPTLVNASAPGTGARGYNAADTAPALEPLPRDRIFASFVSSYPVGPPSPAPFARNGLPARVKRGENRSLRTRFSKAIIVQFPLAVLGQVGLHTHPRTLADIAARRQQHAATRNIRGIGTVYDFEAIELTGPVRERELLGLVLKTLMMGGDAERPHLIYPPEMLRRPPTKRLARDDGSAVALVEWATLRLLAPDPAAPGGGAAAAAKGKAAGGATAGSSASSFAPVKETDEELLARLFEPDQAAQQQLDKVLAHLERRGGVWTHAGHFTQPSARNPDPKRRTELTIHGCFPSYLLDRFKKYRRSGWLPMPSDLDEAAEAAAESSSSKGKGKKISVGSGSSSASVEPLVLYTVAERLAGVSAASTVAAAAGAGAGEGDGAAEWEKDALEGWSVAVTIEPYRRPRAMWGANGNGLAMVAATGVI